MAETSLVRELAENRSRSKASIIQSEADVNAMTWISTLSQKEKLVNRALKTSVLDLHTYIHIKVTSYFTLQLYVQCRSQLKQKVVLIVQSSSLSIVYCLTILSHLLFVNKEFSQLAEVQFFLTDHKS